MTWQLDIFFGFRIEKPDHLTTALLLTRPVFGSPLYLQLKILQEANLPTQKFRQKFQHVILVDSSGHSGALFAFFFPVEYM